MSEIPNILELLSQSYRGPCWHGPSLMQNLEGITAAQAAQRPIAQGHCVWELVQHLTAWINVVIRVLDGEEYASLAPEQDWPPISADNEAGWKSALAILESSYDAMLGAVGELQDDQLWPPLPGQEFNLYWLLQGVIQHSAYHSGQIGLLRKSFLSLP